MSLLTQTPIFIYKKVDKASAFSIMSFILYKQRTDMTDCL